MQQSFLLVPKHGESINRKERIDRRWMMMVETVQVGKTSGRVEMERQEELLLMEVKLLVTGRGDCCRSCCWTFASAAERKSKRNVFRRALLFPLFCRWKRTTTDFSPPRFFVARQMRF